ncbi:Na+ dependent nucleoside transporter C-terminus-domain-containing protein [Halteromyces radiatus]|uniref:Na+ dependent nucleoside transporter C-terminus-domain-containing protein n=1 Tax=Halteromyces radiatus TaxID=101107 RepID=UPI00221E3D2D|nr:Na+ dependent nucleoside transporter C-terminus-domain-containing protein [Halteromyces radiatus]KAI8096920.1 Na+ dependent nucleoside transporter C-terminus-domain-containing protein [Halteromyces radiatus]
MDPQRETTRDTASRHSEEEKNMTTTTEYYTTEQNDSVEKHHLDTSRELTKADIVEYNYDVNKSDDDDDENRPSWFSKIYQKYRKVFLLVMWLIFTGFIAAAYALQVPKGYNQENLILGLIYAWHSLYVFFCFVPTTVVTKPWSILVRTAYAPIKGFSSQTRSLMYVSLVLVVIVVTVFSLPETSQSTRVQRLIAFVGMILFILGTFASSTNHRAVNWNTISGALLLQFLLALFVFRSSAGHDIFTWLSNFAKGYLGKAAEGAAFLTSEDIVNKGFFAISVFPAVIFFAATVQILYYLGALQWILKKSATVFVALLDISGCEAVVAVASPFLGQSENVLLIKPFLAHLTDAEIHQVMTSGFATISGSVLYGYFAMGVDGTALISSCVMSIPCSIAISKLRYPETQESITKGTVRVPKSEEKLEGIVHAAGVGAATGVQIVLLIAANLIALLALLYAVNAGLTWIGNFITIQQLTLQLITGYILVPVAWLIGADNKDLVNVGGLIATKIWANEFVAYQEMMALVKQGVLTPRTISVTTYALCGFSNLGSIGMQVGVLTALAPNRAKTIATVAVSAMICGAISTFVSASIAGMLF